MRANHSRNGGGMTGERTHDALRPPRKGGRFRPRRCAHAPSAAGMAGGPGRVRTALAGLPAWSVSAALEMMERQSIATAVLSMAFLRLFPRLGRPSPAAR